MLDADVIDVIRRKLPEQDALIENTHVLDDYDRVTHKQTFKGIEVFLDVNNGLTIILTQEEYSELISLYKPNDKLLTIENNLRCSK